MNELKLIVHVLSSHFIVILLWLESSGLIFHIYTSIVQIQYLPNYDTNDHSAIRPVLVPLSTSYVKPSYV